VYTDCLPVPTDVVNTWVNGSDVELLQQVCGYMLRTQIRSGKIVVGDDLYDLLSPTRAVVENETIDDFAALSR
jgi:hypothetical protein